MFGRKILFLAAGYVAGNVVASMYSSKKNGKQKSKKNIDAKHLAEEFITTQKNFLEDMENKYIPESGIGYYEQKKSKLLQLGKKYSQDGKQFWNKFKNTPEYQKGKKYISGLMSQESSPVKK